MKKPGISRFFLPAKILTSRTKNLGTAEQISNTVNYILNNDNVTEESICILDGIGLAQ